MSTWRELIAGEMRENGESWDDVVDSIIVGQPRPSYVDEDDWEWPEPSFDRTFDGGYGSEYGDLFTVWTSEFVYFPVCYDGAEWAGSVPRNPGGRANRHVGGG